MYSSELTTKAKIEGFNTRFTIAGVTDTIPNPITGLKIGGEEKTEWITVPVIFQCFHKDLGEDGYLTTIHREPSHKHDGFIDSEDPYNVNHCMIVHRLGWGADRVKVYTTSIFNQHMEQTIKYSDIQVLTAIDNDRKECSFYTRITPDGNPIVDFSNSTLKHL